MTNEYKYPSGEDHKAGMPIESIKEWFPPATIKGRLPEEVLAQLEAKYPEPAEAVLKASGVDIDLLDDIPRHALAGDAKARGTARDFANAFKPILLLAIAVQNNSGIPEDVRRVFIDGLRDAVYLHNHAVAVVEEDRRLAIGRAIDWPESMLSKSRTIPSEDRSILFGEQLVADHRRWSDARRADRAIWSQKMAINNLAKTIISQKPGPNNFPQKSWTKPKPQHQQPPKGEKGSQKKF
jgi:hypothetical protein